jgi:hypothetical protein
VISPSQMRCRLAQLPCPEAEAGQPTASPGEPDRVPKAQKWVNSLRKFKRVLTVAATAAAASAMLPFGQAHAAVTPAMGLSITNYSSYHRVCASGNAADPLQVLSDWELTIDGTRANGSVINQTAGSSGNTFSYCMNVYKAGTVQGEYHVAFLYTGVGPDVYGKRTGYGSWQPNLADVVGTLPV